MKDLNAPRRPFRRAEGGGERSPGDSRPARPFRRFDAQRAGGKPPFKRRSAEEGAEERPSKGFRPSSEGRPPRRDRDDRGGREAGGRPAAKFGSKFASKFASKSASKFGSKRPPSRREGGFSERPERAGGERPFGSRGSSGKRPAKRTFKRREDESA